MKGHQVLNRLPALLLMCIWLLPAGGVKAQENLLPVGRPLTLAGCIAIALKYHPSLQAGQATVAAQKAKLEQALAAYYPQINFNTSYTTSTANYSAAGHSSADWSFGDLFATGPTLNQMIYDFGRTAGNVRLNRENVTASTHDLQTVSQNVILNVKQSYYSVLQTLALIKVAEETLTQNQKRLTQAQGFYRAGTRSKIDVTKAEVDLANVQLALIRAKNNFRVARATLNNAMGLKENLNFAVDEDVDFQPRTLSLVEILDSAYEHRPEILQLKARQRGQEAALDQARAGYYPSLSGNVSNLWRSDQAPDDLAWDLSVGATLTIPIFSGFATTGQVAEAKALRRSLQAQEESLRQDIRLEAEQAFLGLTEAQERIFVTRQTMQQARENYDLASRRYEVGIGQPLEINDAEVLLANARANHINALYDCKVAEARIEKAMGQR